MHRKRGCIRGGVELHRVVGDNPTPEPKEKKNRVILGKKQRSDIWGAAGCGKCLLGEKIFDQREVSASYLDAVGRSGQ